MDKAMGDDAPAPKRSGFSSRIASNENINPNLQDHTEEEFEEELSSTNSDDDDSVAEASSELCKLSISKSLSEEGSESSDGDLEEPDVQIPDLDEKDEKSYIEVMKLIEGGKLDKLKVDQCKVYLRKYGLRLTGKKAILLERIREHLEIKDGSGESKYPKSSFVLNCQGDACTGDIVMFEQNVYDMYNIASRSATGPSIGTRVVVGRIVKESYGLAKQQHTFTIEVLWSTGVKPLLPLHPLLIKGRNLYRLNTVRQPWSNEDERKKVLEEKHSRGYLARCTRDNRVRDKKLGRSNRARCTKKENVSVCPENKATGCENGNSSSLSAQTFGFPKNNQGNTNRVVGSLQDGNMLESFSVAYKQEDPNAGYLGNMMQSAASTVGLLNSSFTRGDISMTGQIQPKTMPLHPEISGFMGKTAHAAGLPNLQSLRSIPVRDNGLLGARAMIGFPPRKIEPCRHFARGRCNYGDRCRFAHDMNRG